MARNSNVRARRFRPSLRSTVPLYAPLTQERVRRQFYVPPGVVRLPVRTPGRLSTVSSVLSSLNVARRARRAVARTRRSVIRRTPGGRPLLQVIDASAELRRRITGVCFGRRIRRSVLFALKVAGRSGGSPGRDGTYRYVPESEVSC